MSGKILSIAIIVITALFGVGVWYAQTRAYYAPIEITTLTLQSADGDAITVTPETSDGIEGTSSPLKFRVCFTVSPERAAELLQAAAPHPDPVPLIAPAWFDCYNGTQLGADLEAGAVTGLIGQIEISRGVDRVFALYPDGTGYGWHQLNGTLE